MRDVELKMMPRNCGLRYGEDYVYIRSAVRCKYENEGLIKHGCISGQPAYFEAQFRVA